MPSYFYVEPEVGGNVVMHSKLVDPTATPLQILELHYEFDGWLGDPIVESIGCHIVTEPVADRLCSIGATGVQFDRATVSASDQFEEVHSGLSLPKFLWLKAIGRPGIDDVGLYGSGVLVVSESVLKELEALGMRHAEINDFSKPLPDPMAAFNEWLKNQ
jgi:hypothetical protein